MSELQVAALPCLKAELSCFFLKLGHALQITDWRNATEQPSQIGVTDDVGLHKNIRTLWIEPTGDILCDARKRIFAQVGG